MKKVVLFVLLVSFLFIDCTSGSSSLDGYVGINFNKMLLFENYCKYLDDIDIKLIKDGKIVKETRTTDGYYSFDGISEGEYSVNANIFQDMASVESNEIVYLTGENELVTYDTLFFESDYNDADSNYIEEAGDTIKYNLKGTLSLNLIIYSLTGENLASLHSGRKNPGFYISLAGVINCYKGIINFAVLETEEGYEGGAFTYCADSVGSF